MLHALAPSMTNFAGQPKQGILRSANTLFYFVNLYNLNLSKYIPSSTAPQLHTYPSGSSCTLRTALPHQPLYRPHNTLSTTTMTSVDYNMQPFKDHTLSGVRTSLQSWTAERGPQSVCPSQQDNSARIRRTGAAARDTEGLAGCGPVKESPERRGISAPPRAVRVTTSTTRRGHDRRRGSPCGRQRAAAHPGLRPHQRRYAPEWPRRCLPRERRDSASAWRRNQLGVRSRRANGRRPS
jgi:hypothetical protein